MGTLFHRLFSDSVLVVATGESLKKWHIACQTGTGSRSSGLWKATYRKNRSWPDPNTLFGSLWTALLLEKAAKLFPE